MLKHIAVVALLALSGSAALVGCVKEPIQGRADPFAPLQIDFASDDLRNHTAVGTPIVNRDPTNQLVNVTVPVRAATDLQLYVDYSVDFLDASGTPISHIGWTAVTLPPNVFTNIQFNSLSPRAADFRVHLRYAK